MKCFVTGAAGFIGSHLCERLWADGHEVLGIDSLTVGRKSNLSSLLGQKRFDFLHTTNESLLYHYHNIDWFFHLGALADIVPSIDDPVRYHHANVTGTIAALECAKKSNAKRFLYAASSSCYGIPEIYPTPETSPCKPMYPYALTKYLGEQYVMHYSQVYGIPAMSLRLFNVFGPRARTSGTYGAVFGVFLSQLAHGKPLTVVGDGNQTRDFTYVGDVVNAFVCAAESDCRGIFNVGSDNTYSVNHLVSLLGSKDIVYLPKRPGEPDCTFADIEKIRTTLGWEPEYNFDACVELMLEHLSDYKDAPLWEKESIERATRDWFKYLK